MFFQNERLNLFRAKAVEDLAQLRDYRLFARLLYTSSLKVATSFLSGSHTDADIAQVDTIYRCGYDFKTNIFRTVQHFFRYKMYRCALLALDEKEISFDVHRQRMSAC